MMQFFEENPAQAKIICLKATDGARARIAARKAKELTRRKSPLDHRWSSWKNGGLPIH